MHRFTSTQKDHILSQKWMCDGMVYRGWFRGDGVMGWFRGDVWWDGLEGMCDGWFRGDGVMGWFRGDGLEAMCVGMV